MDVPPVAGGRMYNCINRVRDIDEKAQIEYLVSLIDKYYLKVVTIGIGGKYPSKSAYLNSPEKTSLCETMLIEQKDTKLEITTKYHDDYPMKACTFVFDLNGQESCSVSGLQTFTEISKYFKMPKAQEYKMPELDRWFSEESGKYACSARPILDYNKKYQGQDINDCYEYDLNSAYFSNLLKEVPDLWHPYQNTLVKANQIGFLLDDNLTLVDHGYDADVVFDLIPTPDKLKKYCDKWYTLKKNAPTVKDKLRAKAYLNLPIGYSQRYNPFFRAYVVNKCNRTIKKLITKETLFWNTDAIFSKTKLNLDIGKEIGQFKEIHCNRIRYIGNTYQVDDEIPTYRGIPKRWFQAFEKENGRKFNLLTDKAPKRANLYTWNMETLKLTLTEDL